MPSIEEQVEEYFKKELDKLNVRHYGKTEKINDSITAALSSAESKSGGVGGNYPDIQLLIENNTARRIPVMMEAKGTKNKLEKLNKKGEIDDSNTSVKLYAVNGALHYGNAILDEGTYEEVLIIGVNGSSLNTDGTVKDPECKTYYLSKKNNRLPKHVKELDDDLSLLANHNVDKLFAILDELNLTEDEIEMMKNRAEIALETKIKSIHQSLYDDERLKTLLSTNEKLYLFCGLIMAGLTTEGLSPLSVSDLKSDDDTETNDSTKIISRIRSFLKKKKCSEEKIEMILNLLTPVFAKETLWKPNNGESIIKNLYKQVKEDIVPCLESNLHLDFTGKILNSLNDWVSVENDVANDVVLTPRYVTTFMSKLARTNKDSFVWDRAMGSAGFLVSAMDIMIKDAKEKIKDTKELEEKIKNIKEKQLLGVEILGNIYILAVLNMILMGDGSSNIICGNGHDENIGKDFPATVFLLNPPYSAPGKGFCFVEEALSMMTKGYACVLIQENAGAGQGGDYTKRLLKNNTLIASIHMPDKLFTGKASVQTAIYVFQVARPHEEDDIVKFIDFSNDGYARQNRKKSSQEVNLRNADHATERYAEVEAIVLGKKPKTDYYTKENGLYIEDTIEMDGTDWTFSQHKVIDTTPTEEDFKKTVAEYLSFRVGQILRGEG